MKTRQWILEALVFLTALLFIYTAASKLADINAFQEQIDNQIFDDAFTPYLTWGIPLTELGIATLLVWSKTRVYGFAGFTLLMAVFTGYVALVTAQVFDRVPCGCATAFEHLSWSWHLVLNIVFFLAGGTGLILAQKERI